VPLYKRKDSPNWWFKLSQNGRLVQGSTGTPDRRRALEYHDKLKVQLWDEEKLGRKPQHTWEEAVLQYLEESKHKASLVTDKFHLRWLDPHLSSMELSNISRDTVEKLIAAASAEGVKSSTINRRLEILRAILRKAWQEWEWIDRVPKIRMLKEPPGRVRHLSAEEIRRLLSELPEHKLQMARFSLATGLRQRNVKDLKWSQVDIERRMAWIHAHEAKARTAIPVPLTIQAVQILREQQGQHLEYVFTYKGQPVTQVGTKAWRKAVQRAGIQDFRWHDLRHTWASLHIQNGTPVHALQELGGWKSSEMVKRYAHLNAEHLARYADQFSDRADLTGLLNGYDSATLENARQEKQDGKA